MMFFGACSNEELFEQTNPAANLKGRTLSITASMPDEPTTRVGLEQKTDKTIALTWEVGDKLQLAFVQGTIKVKQKVVLTAENITDGGKKAKFDIELPASTTGFKDNVNFNLYGVCGGGSKWMGVDLDVPNTGGAGGGGTLTQYYDGDALELGDADTNPYVKLPSNTGSVKSLETVHFRKDVMLTFTSKDIDVANPQVLVAFNHLGSLFNITLKNTGTTSLENLDEAQLVGINNPDNQNWAYNAGTGGKTYDLVTGKFLDTENGGNFISLKAAASTLEAGATTTFWAWYPPAPDKVWPELQLQLKDGTTPEATTLTMSINSKPARASATAAGKAYYFYAAWSEGNLKFTDNAFTPIWGGR